MTSSDPRFGSSGDLAVGIENAIQSPPAPRIVPNAIPLARRNIQASTMLLAEWIALFHPTATVLFEYRIGLVPQTADLAKYKALPIVPVWLCGLTNPVMAELANELKVQFVVYSPSWIMDYMNRD